MLFNNSPRNERIIVAILDLIFGKRSALIRLFQAFPHEFAKAIHYLRSKYHGQSLLLGERLLGGAALEDFDVAVDERDGGGRDAGDA